MNYQKKNTWGWIAFGFVVFHVVCISIYAAPEKYISPKNKQWVSYYSFPFFEQRWSMFAPCPVIDGKIKVKLYSDTDSTDWFYPGDDFRSKHKIFRGSWHSDLVIFETNLLWWVHYNFEEAGGNLSNPNVEALDEAMKEGIGALMMRRFVGGLGRQVFGELPAKANVICEFNNVLENREYQYKYPSFYFR